MIPVKFDSRLLFCCCRTCAKIFDIDTDNTLTGIKFPDPNNDENMIEINSIGDVCTHSDEERSFITVVDHDELAHAIKRGYKVSKIFNALVWPDKDADGDDCWSSDLFKGF